MKSSVLLRSRIRLRFISFISLTHERKHLTSSLPSPLFDLHMSVSTLRLRFRLRFRLRLHFTSVCQPLIFCSET